MPMAEFWSIMTLLRSSCEDNTDLQKTCQEIASNYTASQKKEIYAQFVYEQNIILKIEVGNLDSISDIVTRNNETQSKLDSLLKELYDEHLKTVYNIDECELDKLSNFDVLKLELQNRPSIDMFQQLYWRKMETAMKMEERNIVKKYRQAEQEHQQTNKERLDLEEKINAWKIKSDEFKEREKEEIKLIIELVMGSKELENIAKNQDPLSQLEIFPSLRISEDISLKIITPQKAGLSSKLMVNFNKFTMPAPVHSLPRYQQLYQTKGLSSLLQQSEVIRRSIQTEPIVLSNEQSTPQFSGILKTHKTMPVETTPKTVSFDIDVQKKDLAQTMEFETQGTEGSLEIIDDSKMEESPIEKLQKIEIIEDVLIKPADQSVQRQQVAQPTEIVDKKNRDPSPIKISSSSSSKDTPTFKVPTKSFVDMLYDVSSDIDDDVPSPAFEILEKPSKAKTKTPKATKKAEPKPKSKASANQFEDFDKMFSDMASNQMDTEGLENLDNNQTFDFFLDNDGDEEKKDDDAESDTFSFNF